MDRWERKRRLPAGAITAIAKKEQVAVSLVSMVVNDNALVVRLGSAKVRRVRAAIARKIGEPVAKVFPKATQGAA